ncbi:MAG: ATP-binding protein [Gluconacetobacter sp.]
MITTNLSFDEWNDVSGGPKRTAVLLDRLTPNCHFLETGNDSHQFRSRTAAPKTERIRQPLDPSAKRRGDNQRPGSILSRNQ